MTQSIVGSGETATPHRSKSKQAQRAKAYGGHLALFWRSTWRERRRGGVHVAAGGVPSDGVYRAFVGSP